MVTVNEDCILNSPTPIAALTNGIAAIFVPRRSVRLFVLATLAICAAGVMWIACNQSKPSVSAECSQDVQCHWWVESYFKVGEFDYAESMLRKCIAVHSSFGCSHCVSQVQDKRYLALVLSKQGRLAESNAIFNELFEAAVAHSEGNDVFLHEDFRAVANCSPHEHGYRVEDLLILQANPTPCRLHKNCEHDVEVEARGLFGHRQVSSCRTHESYPQPESGWVTVGRAGALDSSALPGHIDGWIDVIESRDSRYSSMIPEFVKNIH